MRALEIPWCAPDLSGNELAYLAEAISTGQIGPAGTFITRFERAIAERAGARSAIAVCSGTAALHIAALLAGVGPGQEVIVPAWTFVASANAIRHAGGYPVVLDVDPGHWQLDSSQIHHFLTTRCRHRGGRLIHIATGRAVTAIAPVHLLGHPADRDAIRATAEEYRLAVIEDAAQGFGAAYRGRPLGSDGLMAVSFNANKLITSGCGGAILTDDAQAADRARYLINQAREHPIEYRHGQVGFNYRMSNLQAAVGYAQLERVDTFIKAKRTIFDRYTETLGRLDGLTFQAEAPWARATRWFSTLSIDPVQVGITADQLRTRLAEHGIQAGPPWTPLHLTGAHRAAAPCPCPIAERLGRTTLHLPCSVGLTQPQQDRVIEAVRSAIRRPATH